MADYDHDRPSPGNTRPAAAGEQPPKVKKPYVRIMTDKRREQNRRAQKVYREKQKKRLEALDDKNASSDSDVSLPPQASTSTIPTREEIPRSVPSFIGGETQDFALEEEQGDDGQDEDESRPEPDEGPITIFDFNSIFESNGDIPVDLSDSMMLLTDFLPSHPSPPLPQPPPPPTFTATLPQYGSGSTRFPGGGSRGPSEPNYQDNYWPMPPTSQDEPYLPPPADATGSYTPYMAGSLPLMSRSYAYNRQLRLLEAHAHDPNSDPGTSAGVAGVGAGATTSTGISLPSPYLNTLHLTSESSLTASLAIALSLGISRNHYLRDHPSPIATCFQKIAGAPQPYVNDVLQRHARGIAPSLRPHLIQYTHPHPSYLDCIVFPSLRARAVSASVAGTLDHVEFFLDLMHGGMVCWGGGTPATSRNTRGGVRGRDSSSRLSVGGEVAWSARSWEARRWFLEKWAWLVGGEEEEERHGGGSGVWECSRGWWRVRGEEWLGGDDGEGEEEDEAGKAWAEGWYQGRWEGARRFEDILEAAKAEYIPMSGNQDIEGVL